MEIGTVLTKHSKRVMEAELSFCVNHQSRLQRVSVEKGLRHVWNGERWCKHDIKARSVK